jgi:hypothetical protein
VHSHPSTQRIGRTDVPDGSGVRCDYRQGVVTVTCGPEAFVRVAEAVAAAAGPPVAVPADAEVVRVERVKPPATPEPPWAWYDWAGLVGCVGVVGTVLFLLGTGAYTVSRWVLQP